MLTPKPPQDKLQGWIIQLERAQKFQEELFQQNKASIELRFDIALTRFEKAFLLATKTTRFEDAIEELSAARDTFLDLANRFEENRKYEFYRILVFKLSALVQAKNAKFVEAARELEEAEKAIRKYNGNSTARREEVRDDVRLDIAEHAKWVVEDLLDKDDRINAARIITWLLPAIRELRRAADQEVQSKAIILAAEVEKLDARIKASSGSSK